jgi:hypothetical protein
MRVPPVVVQEEEVGGVAAGQVRAPEERRRRVREGEDGGRGHREEGGRVPPRLLRRASARWTACSRGPRLLLTTVQRGMMKWQAGVIVVGFTISSSSLLLYDVFIIIATLWFIYCRGICYLRC